MVLVNHSVLSWLVSVTILESVSPKPAEQENYKGKHQSTFNYIPSTPPPGANATQSGSISRNKSSLDGRVNQDAEELARLGREIARRGPLAVGSLNNLLNQFLSWSKQIGKDLEDNKPRLEAVREKERTMEERLARLRQAMNRG